MQRNFRTDNRRYVRDRRQPTPPPVPRNPVLFCLDCGIELDRNDVDANLNTWGVFKGYCSDDIENHVED